MIVKGGFVHVAFALIKRITIDLLLLKYYSYLQVPFPFHTPTITFLHYKTLTTTITVL